MVTATYQKISYHSYKPPLVAREYVLSVTPKIKEKKRILNNKDNNINFNRLFAM